MAVRDFVISWLGLVADCFCFRGFVISWLSWFRDFVVRGCMKRVGVAVLLSVRLLAAATATAQPAVGSITGTVTSNNGVGLTGVTVVARSRVGPSRDTVTREDGSYEISNLPVDGPYTVQAQVAGLTPVARENVTLVAGGKVVVDFILRGAIAESIAVTALTPPLQHDRAAVQQIVSEQLVHSLPLIGRDFLDLASLTAGFTGNRSAPSPHGQIYWSNNVLVDGGSHFSKWRSAARTFYSGYGLESIKEVQVLSSQFSAEFGEALATVTNVVTNSGTSELRGTALLFAQDGALNDRPAFVSRKPPGTSQRFGFAVGGPFAREGTHFFGSYEGWRARGRNIVVSPAASEALVDNDEDQHLLFWRIDHRVGDRQSFTGRYNGQWFRWHNEAGGLTLPGTGTAYTNDVHTIFFTDTILLSNRLLNQPRVQFARYVDVRRDLDPRAYVSRAGYSLEGGILGPWGFGADPEDTWEAADTFSYTQGLHSLKFGGGFKYVRAHNAALAYGHGAYFFAGPPDAYPLPYSFAQGVSPSPSAVVAEPRGLGGYGFVQDDWRLRPRITLNAGVRYDVERISNIEGFDARSDKNNVQPRIGVAIDPTGAGRMTLRGGVGIYNQQHLLYYINRVQLEGPDGAIALVLTPDSTLMPIFPNALPPALSTIPPRDIQRVDPGFGNPYSLQVAAGVERMLFGTLVAADYLHLRGIDLMSLIDRNAPASIQKPAHRTVAQADATRPIAPTPNGFRKIIELGNEGASWYHALQVKANRPSGPLRTMVSYTFAKAEDQVNYLLPEDSRNLAAEKGPADSDIRHNVAAGFTWEVPGSGAARGGWMLSGIGFFRSARPYTLAWGDDRNGTTQNDARPGGRNTERGDRYRSVDLAASKRLTLSHYTVEFRAEVFNILSATNYDEYVGVLASPAFGRPISAFPRRRIQIAAIARF